MGKSRYKQRKKMSLIFNYVVNFTGHLISSWNSNFCSFTSAWRISFSISCTAQFLLRNPLSSLVYLKMLKIPLYFLKDNFAGYRILSYQGFFLFFVFVLTFSIFNSHPIAFWPPGFLTTNQLLVLRGSLANVDEESLLSCYFKYSLFVFSFWLIIIYRYGSLWV